MNDLFVSIVGTQVMAVLNPLLALCDAGTPPQQIALFATTGKHSTLPQAQKIREFLLEYAQRKGVILAPVDFFVVPISATLFPDSDGNPSAQQAVAKLLASLPETKRLCFNAAGGMNFQVAAVASVLGHSSVRILYPDHREIYLFDYHDGIVSRAPSLPLPAPVNVLSLQNIPHTVHGGKVVTGKLLSATVRELLPPVHQNNLQIGHLNFEHAWNDGNTLCFMKIVERCKDSNMCQEDYRRAIRDLIVFANNRALTGELYNRKIILVTNDDTSAERTELESVKVEVHHVQPFKVAQRTSFAAVLNRRALGNPAPPVKSVRLDLRPQPGPPGRTLYLCLGANITPTLTAIASCAPATVHCFCTFGDPNIERYLRAFYKHKEALPTSLYSLIYHPTSHLGEAIMNFPPPVNPTQTEVNVTPGTKLQGFFLSLWATRHGVPITSLNNGVPQVESFDGTRVYPLTTFDPLQTLLFEGQEIKSAGTDAYALMKLSTAKTIRDTLEFLRQMKSEKKEWKSFFYQPTAAKNGATLTPQFRSQGLTGVYIQVPGENKKFLNVTDKGQWFENLIGIACCEAGANSVYVRVRLHWGEKNRAYVEKRFGEEGNFRTDIDAAVVFDNNMAVIECKSGDKKEITQAARQAKAQAALLGRFTRAFVAFLQYDGEPYLWDGDVWIFGWQTLCDPPSLRAVIENSFQQVRNSG